MNTGTPERVTSPRVTEAPEERLVLPKGYIRKLTTGSTTPAVDNTEVCEAQNSGAVTVTDFVGGQPAQHLYILGDGFTTVTHGTRIKTNTAANKLLAANKVYHFVRFSSVWIEVEDASGGGGGGSVPAYLDPDHPDAYPGTPEAEDDEFNDDTDMSGPGNGLDSKWTQRNQGTSTIDFELDHLLYKPQIGASSVNYRGIHQPLTIPSVWRMKCQTLLVGGGWNLAGFYLRENGTGKVMIIGLGLYGGSGCNVAWTYGSGDTTEVTGGNYLAGGQEGFDSDAYLEVEFDGTNIITRMSRNGVGEYHPVGTVAETTPFTTAPDQIGIGNYSFTGNQIRFSAQFFRKVA